MSSAGYHLGAFSEGAGTVLDSPFFAPPICLVFGAVADILLEKDKSMQRNDFDLKVVVVEQSQSRPVTVP